MIDIDRKQLYRVLDQMASSYGWSLEYIMTLPRDVIFKLYEARADRKKEELEILTKLMAKACNVGFSGDSKAMQSLDDLFNKEENSEEESSNMSKEAWKSQNKSLWIKMGKDPEEFEKRWNNGENIKF